MQVTIANVKLNEMFLRRGTLLMAVALTAIAGPLRPHDAMAQNQEDSAAPEASGVVASVEARWDGVYCDLLSVSNAIPGELTIRYRYRNLSPEDFTFPTLKDYVRETERDVPVPQ